MTTNKHKENLKKICDTTYTIRGDELLGMMLRGGEIICEHHVGGFTIEHLSHALSLVTTILTMPFEEPEEFEKQKKINRVVFRAKNGFDVDKSEVKETMDFMLKDILKHFED